MKAGLGTLGGGNHFIELDKDENGDVYAACNRHAILDELVKRMKWKILEEYSSVHNYVDMNDRILRKGAVSAQPGENVLIPINMRDGLLIGKGLGNQDWNYSAPHGAGRILRRDKVKEYYTVSAYKKEMKGIYSSCIVELAYLEPIKR